MTTIGTFTREGDTFTGTIMTLALKAKAAIKPNNKTAEHAPDYRIYASGAEIGAAWSKVSEANKPYLSIKLTIRALPPRSSPASLDGTMAATSWYGAADIKGAREPPPFTTSTRQGGGGDCDMPKTQSLTRVQRLTGS